MQLYTNTLRTPADHKFRNTSVLMLYISLALILILPSGGDGSINIRAPRKTYCANGSRRRFLAHPSPIYLMGTSKNPHPPSRPG